MASLYKKQGSPFWYLQFVDAEGNPRTKSTGLRHDCPKDTAKARLVAAKVGADHAFGTALTPSSWGWVEGFLQEHCRDPRTLQRYKGNWEWLSLYMAERRIMHPAQVRFEHAGGYVAWRTSYKKKTGKKVARNTAIMEVKLWSLIMQRAVQLEMREQNPLVRMGLKKDAAEQKPEIAPEEFDIILEALKAEPEWMRLAFSIAMHTGCRLSETVIPRQCIDFQRKTILFPDPKGGPTRAFTVPLPPQLEPVLRAAFEDGRQTTLALPFQPSRQWNLFFKRLKLGHLCFHCLRVTYVTDLARRGVPLSVAMRLVNHASDLIHRIYQRLNVEDLRGYAVGLQSVGVAPAASGAEPASNVQNPL